MRSGFTEYEHARDTLFFEGLDRPGEHMRENTSTIDAGKWREFIEHHPSGFDLQHMLFDLGKPLSDLAFHASVCAPDGGQRDPHHADRALLHVLSEIKVQCGRLDQQVAGTGCREVDASLFAGLSSELQTERGPP
jgi:hypothetical protein